MPHRLLLADDSVTIQRVIELTFADEDIRVTAVGDGQQAIDRIAAEPPDIVLADVGMPGRDGYEVARFIKDDPRLSHIPVLLLTGAFEPVDEARARQVRCDGVLAKPFEPQLLIARVKELLRRPAAVAVPTAAGEPVEGNLPPADDDLVLDARQMLEGAPPRSLDAEGSLDDYFDRLDQAFANLAGTAAPHRDPLPRPAADLSWAPDEIRASSWPLADTVGPARERRAPAAPATASAAGLMSLPMADAFSALLQAESTEDPRAADRTSVFVQGRPEGSDAALDAIVERVIERLGLQQGQVAALVSEIAERLVREEIERLKAASGR